MSLSFLPRIHHTQALSLILSRFPSWHPTPHKGEWENHKGEKQAQTRFGACARRREKRKERGLKRGRGRERGAFVCSLPPSHHPSRSILSKGGGGCSVQSAPPVFQLSWPQSAILMVADVLPDPDPYPSTFLTTSIPFVTEPKTTCFPSSHSVLTVHRKNWEPVERERRGGEGGRGGRERKRGDERKGGWHSQGGEERARLLSLSSPLSPLPPSFPLTVGVGPRVGHGQHARARVLELEVLVCELLAVDGLAAGAVAAGEVAALGGGEGGGRLRGEKKKGGGGGWRSCFFGCRSVRQPPGASPPLLFSPKIAPGT